MEKDKILEELHEFLPERLEKTEKKIVSIIKDKKQFSIRIPAKFAEAAYIDSSKHKFEFSLIKPRMPSKKEPQLIGRLVKA